VEYKWKGIDALRGKLKKVQKKLIDPDKLDVLAQDLIAMINMRLDKGQGLTAQMPEYNPLYAEYRKKRGRQVAVRDLTGADKETSGAMRAAIAVIKKKKGGVVIGFNDQEQMKIAKYNQDISKWFGLNGKESQYVIDRIKQMVNDAVKS
jgi:hypothetical protein